MSLKSINNTMAHCTLLRKFEYLLEWLPENNYPNGTEVELRSGCLRSIHSWHYVKSDMEKADITYRWIYPHVPSDLVTNRQLVILRAKLPYGAKKGTPIRISLTVIPPIWSGIDECLSIWVKTSQRQSYIRSSEIVQVEMTKETGSECILPVAAGPVERLSIYCRPTPDMDGKVKVCIIPEDRFGNPGELVNSVNILMEWNGTCQNTDIKGTKIICLNAPKEIGRLKVRMQMSDLSLDENISNGIIEGEQMILYGNPVLPMQKEGLSAVFGEFHWHTEFSSDGQRSISEAFKAARDLLNMDFAASADHNTTGQKWKQTITAVEEFNNSSDFITFYGWENGTEYGHENYYFLNPEHPLICGGEAGITKQYPHEIREKLEKYDGFMAIPHHTNAMAESVEKDTGRPFWFPYIWENPKNYIRLVEIMQIRGNQERNEYTDAWRGWHGNGSSVQDALSKGFHVGFTGGTDNHCGWPGRAFAEEEGAMKHNPKSVILTGVWTEKNDREGVFNSLFNRNTWAVWDTRAIVMFRVNNVLMGNELEVIAGNGLEAEIIIHAEDALQSVEIISDSKTVWGSPFIEKDIHVRVPLGKALNSNYFYLRALERKGGIIYASPVFVTILN